MRYLTDAEVDYLADRLAQLPEIERELAIALTGQTRQSDGSGPRSQPRSRPPYPIHLQVLADELKAKLVAAVRDIEETRGPVYDSGDTATACGVWLTRHRSALQTMELWMSSHGECSEPPQGPSFHERVRIRESARTSSGAPTFGTGPGTHLGDGISPRPTPSSRGGSASQERRPSGQPARELGAVEQEPTGGGASRRPSGVGDTDSGALRTGPTDHDPVNKPQHYRSHASGVECIQITEHMGFCLGNAVKYIWRADLKGNAIEDLEKARWYLDREIGRRYRAEVPGCSCGICAPGFIGMRLCRTCGDKRCIGALDHRKHKGTADV